METIRLDKLISDRLNCSRAQARAMIRSGQVRVNGTAVRSPEQKVSDDCVEAAGRMLSTRQHLTLLLNKPAGYVCALRDKEHPTVMELIPESLRRKGLVPVGRLDKDTVGMLLLTTDGALCHQLISPQSHLPKLYLATLSKPYAPDYARRFAEGLLLGDGTRCLPAEIMPDPKDPCTVLVQVTEGKYHQVRRMLAAVENHVETLSRIQIGGLRLHENLALGACMEILHKEMEMLLKIETFEASARSIFGNNSSNLIKERHEVWVNRDLKPEQ